MFEALKRLFRKPPGHRMPDGSIVFTPDGKPPDTSDPVAEAVARAATAAEFARLLREHGVHVIGKNFHKEGDESVFDFVDAPGEFYVFSSQDRAAEFVQTVPVAGVTSYSVLGLNADFLLTNDFSDRRLVLNPKGRFEREVTREDLEELREGGAS